MRILRVMMMKKRVEGGVGRDENHGEWLWTSLSLLHVCHDYANEGGGIKVSDTGHHCYMLR